MMQVVVAYPSKHGSTEGIAQAIANRLRGWDATARSVEDVTDLSDAEAVVLGSPVYAGLRSKTKKSNRDSWRSSRRC